MVKNDNDYDDEDCINMLFERTKLTFIVIKMSSIVFV
jgi:hypothetical protein